MPCLVALSTHWAMKGNSTWNRSFQITKPCLCVKCQIWVTKVKKKKKKLNHPRKWPTTCAVPVMHLRLTFVAFHRVVILRFPINCTINCCMDFEKALKRIFNRFSDMAARA